MPWRAFSTGPERSRGCYADFYAGDAGAWMLDPIPARFRPAVVNRMLGRRADDLPRERIRTFSASGPGILSRQALASDTETRSAAYLAGGKKFGRKVAAAGFGNATGRPSSPSTLRHLKS